MYRIKIKRTIKQRADLIFDATIRLISGALADPNVVWPINDKSIETYLDLAKRTLKIVESDTGEIIRHPPYIPSSKLIPDSNEDISEEYLEPEYNPENLNLNYLGKQMLEKALERNGGDRKKAAHELGISDRTLCRRLKQFDLA